MDIRKMIDDISVPGNVVVLEKEGAEVTIFDRPLVGIASAGDPLFLRFKTDPEAIGDGFLLPEEWLPGAVSVVSLFFPYTDDMRSRERANLHPTEPSEAWLYARVEGDDYIQRFMAALRDRLAEAGVSVCVPKLDPRMTYVRLPTVSGGAPDFHVVPTWSERHAAFVCGLGTFGLSRGIITKRGMAGRLGSLIADLSLEPTPRTYTDIYEWCIRCGECARRCPMRAISFEHYKNNVLCRTKIDETRVTYAPRYGCGKCQTVVPCEYRDPRETLK